MAAALGGKRKTRSLPSDSWWSSREDKNKSSQDSRVRAPMVRAKFSGGTKDQRRHQKMTLSFLKSCT